VPQPPVFFADRAELQRDVVVLSGAEGRHAATVRRLRPGERADVGDGAGLVAECVVVAAGPPGLELSVRARRQVPRPDLAVTVVQAIPKGDRGELAVEELTEVGVDRIVPWAAARCVPVWQGTRGERSPRVDTGSDACRLGPGGLRRDHEGGVRDRPRTRRRREPRPPEPARRR
jgi:16S rRNA (uracil1498-N3)-methyltransferase